MDQRGCECIGGVKKDCGQVWMNLTRNSRSQSFGCRIALVVEARWDFLQVLGPPIVVLFSVEKLV